MRPPATREPREPEAARTTRRDSENEGDHDIPHPREPSPCSYKHHLHVACSGEAPPGAGCPLAARALPGTLRPPPSAAGRGSCRTADGPLPEVSVQVRSWRRPPGHQVCEGGVGGACLLCAEASGSIGQSQGNPEWASGSPPIWRRGRRARRTAAGHRRRHAVLWRRGLGAALSLPASREEMGGLARKEAHVSCLSF